MTKQSDTIALAGRFLLAVLFLMSGIGKLAAPAATQGYIAAMGLPLPFVAITVTPMTIATMAIVVNKYAMTISVAFLGFTASPVQDRFPCPVTEPRS